MWYGVWGSGMWYVVCGITIRIAFPFLPVKHFSQNILTRNLLACLAPIPVLPLRLRVLHILDRPIDIVQMLGHFVFGRCRITPLNRF